MERIGIRELRQHASRYLQRVKAGETITITERGEPIAELRPIDEERPESALERLVREGGLRLPTRDWRDLPAPLPPDPGAPSPAKRCGSCASMSVSGDGVSRFVGAGQAWYRRAGVRRAARAPGAVRRADELPARDHRGASGMRRSARASAGMAADVLASVHIVLLTGTVFAAAGAIDPPEVRSLDAIHLATALTLAGELEAIVTYDAQMARGGVAAGAGGGARVA
jgi:prevent-host-death family protein